MGLKVRPRDTASFTNFSGIFVTKLELQSCSALDVYPHVSDFLPLLEACIARTLQLQEQQCAISGTDVWETLNYAIRCNDVESSTFLATFSTLLFPNMQLLKGGSIFLYTFQANFAQFGTFVIVFPPPP